MAFSWQRAMKDPQKALGMLGDDWRTWPPEAQLLLLEELRRRQGVQRVDEVFKLGLHGAQQRIVDEAKRFNVAACGRRFGKSLLGQYVVVRTLLTGAPCAWTSPSYGQLSENWRDLLRILQPIMTEKSIQEHRIQINTGGVLDCWSLDNPDALRGRKYKCVVIDEAAMVRNLGEAWQAAIRPTLGDLQGGAWFLSTPKGSNFFRTIFTWGQDEIGHSDWKSWQMPSTANTKLVDFEAEVEGARVELPERIFQQEYLAEFLDDAGGVFRRVTEAATATPQDHAIEGHDYVIGIDWGKLNDFTVLAVIDVTTKELVAMDRFNQIDYQVQIQRLYALASRFQTKTLIPERNSIGEPLIEQLQRSGYKVHPWVATNASKMEVIDGLSLAFEKSELRILDIPVLLDELQAYEAERLPSGMLRYGAPEGYHDDCIIALALAWHGAHIRPRQVDLAFSGGWRDYY